MTATPLPRRRLDRQSRKQVIGLLIGLAVVWLITLFVAVFGKPESAPPPKYLAQLRRLQNANAEADAKAEYENGVCKLYVLEQSDRQKVPGVPNPAEQIQKLGMRVIAIPFDATDKGKERLQRAAFEYASKFNVAMLRLVDDQGLPTTLPTTRAATSSPATQPSRRAPATTQAAPQQP